MRSTRFPTFALVVAALVAGGLTLSPASALIVERRQSDWAEVAFYEDPAARGASFVIKGEGRDYYGGIPPRNTGGAGGGDLCADLQDNVAGLHVSICFGDDFELESLGSASADGSVLVEVRDPSGAVVGIDTLVYDVAFTAAGPLYPGASLSTRPDPGAGAATTILRGARVTGYLSTPLMGRFELTGRPGVLGRTRALTAFPLAG